MDQFGPGRASAAAARGNYPEAWEIFMMALLEKEVQVAPHGPSLPSSGHEANAGWHIAKIGDTKWTVRATLELNSSVCSDYALSRHENAGRIAQAVQKPQ